jgi:hypothetical protein
MKIRSSVILITLTFGFMALLSKAQAVVPPPDGGYPGGNTAEGQSALLSRTTGLYNTAIGIYSVLSLTNGNFCTGVGAGTLLNNTASENTATGAGALLSNMIGIDNTADGAFALFSNTAAGNTAIGSRALLNNTRGGTLENIQGIDVGPNVAVGWQALESNTLASANTAVGYQALHSFTTGPVGFEQVGLCTAVGFQALANATGGFRNSGFGYQALMNNADGVANTAIGAQTLISNSNGSTNTAVGFGALGSNSTGSSNTANGAFALVANADGGSNTAVGEGALNANTTGNENTAVGAFALQNSTGDSNTALGNGAGLNVTTANNVICIGASVVGANVDDSCYIGNIFGTTSSGGTAVLVNSDGKLGTIVSSRRFKNDIRPMDKASEAILALKPVTFRYKKEFDEAGISQFGLVAEDVEKVNPDLVVRDKGGKPYSVRYDQVNAMLLNEFLKEHHKVEEQQKEIDSLKAELKEQRNLIQKVSDRVEMSKPVARVVAGNQ